MKFPLLFAIALLAGSVCRADLAGDVLNEMNRAREHPGNYAVVVAQQDVSDPKTKAANTETIRFLEKTRPLPPLVRSSSLVLSAQAHVEDTGPSGIIGHTGTDHSTPGDRMARYGKLIGCGGENISYGCLTARAIVMSLIIDQGVGSRGHRKNIFNPKFNLAGVAIGRHLRFGIICVTDFASDFIPNGESEKTPLFR